MTDNSNGHVCNASEDLYTCMPEINGFLLKKGAFGKTSKLWCYLQKSILCMQKSNAPKPQRHSVKTIDLKDCHQVRKVTVEISGAHFEVCQRKKKYVFICPTSENCTLWVKALHAAMVLKDVDHFDSKQNVASCQIDYSDVSDTQKVNRVGNKDNESSEIDVQDSAYSATSDSMKSTDLVDLKDAVSDSEESPFQAVLDILSFDPHIPELVHPLVEEDLKPVEDLREFLNINRELCQVNYAFHPTEDPVNSMKSYLETLSIVKWCPPLNSRENLCNFK